MTNFDKLYILPHLGIDKLRIYTEEIMIEEKLNELYKRQVEVDKYIKDARKIYNDILISSRRVGKSSDFTGKKFLRGNILGDFLRANKNHNANKSIGRIQEELLDFHSNLLLFDEKLANKLYLPSKVSEYSNINGKIADIAFRSKLRMKEVDISKSARSVQKVLMKLLSEKRKIAYDIRKIKEYKDL